MSARNPFARLFAERDLLERNRLWQQCYFLEEYLAIRFLCTPEGPGRIARTIFRLPVWLGQFGGRRAIPPATLLLTATGRRSGLPRTTAMTYRYDGATGSYYVVAGWGERSNWLRNVLANPSVHVRVPRGEFAAVARLAEEPAAMWAHRSFAERNPLAERLWPRLTGEPFDRSERALRRLCELAPVLELHPEAGDSRSVQGKPPAPTPAAEPRNSGRGPMRGHHSDELCAASDGEL